MLRVQRAGCGNSQAGEKPADNPTIHPPIPDCFRCPISLQLMKDPVTLLTGITYDRRSITTWFAAGNRTCPVTKQLLKSLDQIPNHALTRIIQDWFLANRSLAVEQIFSPPEVSAILSQITNARTRRDLAGCCQVIKKINKLAENVELELIEALVNIIKQPICRVTTKASLLAIFYLVSPSAASPSKEKAASKVIDMGLVQVLLEMLVDPDRSICEKALGVLDGLCEYKQGREKVHDHALTVPVLVQKILWVTNLATEFTISILWKLCKKYKGEEEGGILAECLQFGAFQKFLLVVQMDCSERTKEKAKEVLKLMNGCRGKVECIDSMDFKHLKRSFY